MVGIHTSFPNGRMTPEWWLVSTWKSHCLWTCSLVNLLSAFLFLLRPHRKIFWALPVVAILFVHIQLKPWLLWTKGSCYSQNSKVRVSKSESLFWKKVFICKSLVYSCKSFSKAYIPISHIAWLRIYKCSTSLLKAIILIPKVVVQ